MQTREEKAVESYSNGYNCAQSVLSAFCGDNGLDLNTALKLACGFGGGGMRYKQTCGAISGAVMVIGLKCGQYVKGDAESKKYCYQKTKEFTEKFKETNGSVICCELLGIDKNTEIEKDFAKVQPLFKSLCPEFVKSAVHILENMEF